jgi:hypothetical protein
LSEAINVRKNAELEYQTNHTNSEGLNCNDYSIIDVVRSGTVKTIDLKTGEACLIVKLNKGVE